MNYVNILEPTPDELAAAQEELEQERYERERALNEQRGRVDSARRMLARSAERMGWRRSQYPERLDPELRWLREDAAQLLEELEKLERMGGL